MYIFKAFWKIKNHKSIAIGLPNLIMLSINENANNLIHKDFKNPLSFPKVQVMKIICRH